MLHVLQCMSPMQRKTVPSKMPTGFPFSIKSKQNETKKSPKPKKREKKTQPKNPVTAYIFTNSIIHQQVGVQRE